MQGAGDAGDILIEADHIHLSENMRIASGTFGSGKGGTVTIRAQVLSLEGSASILANTQGSLEEAGEAGSILVEANRVHLSEEAQIASGSFAAGKGGTVTIRAQVVSMDGGAAVLANAQGNTEIAGDAGTILIEADRLSISGGAQISSSSFGSGKGGSVIVRAQDIDMRGATPDNLFASGILVGSNGTGDAGDILVIAQQMTLSNGAGIFAETSQSGGGNIQLEVQTLNMVDSLITTTVLAGADSGGNLLIGGAITHDGIISRRLESLTLEGSRIIANTDAGDGGNVAIGARRVTLDNGSDIAANTNAGVGGNVTIAGTVARDGRATSRAETIVLRDSRITARAQEGQGGRIDIVTKALLADPTSSVDASSQEGGIDGAVNVEAVVANLHEVVRPLSQTACSKRPTALRPVCIRA